MIYTLKPRCQCGRQLAPVDGGDSAVFQYHRTCQKCGTRWRVIVRPGIQLPKAGAVAHTVELVAIPGT